MSVVIASRNRAAMLRCTLSRLAHQRICGFTWEVIIVDSGSSDDTSAVLTSASEQLPIVHLRVPAAGKNRALNEALLRATGDLIVFTDDDVIPASDWIGELVSAARRWPGHDVFGGRIALAPPPGGEWIFGVPGLPECLAFYSPLGEEGLTACEPYGPNFAVRTAALEGRHFDEAIGPDGSDDYVMGSETELLRKILKRQPVAVYVPTALVRHIIRPEQIEIPALFTRYDRAGRGQARIAGNSPAPRLLGSPRWLWWALGRAWLDRAGSLRRKGTEALEPRLRYHRLKARIAEHRRMAREASGTPTPPAPTSTARAP